MKAQEFLGQTEGAESTKELRPLFEAMTCCPLQPGDAFGGPNVDRLFHLDPGHFLPRLVEPQHGIVVHLKPLPVDLGLKHLRSWNHIVPEDDLLTGPPELKDCLLYTSPSPRDS